LASFWRLVEKTVFNCGKHRPVKKILLAKLKKVVFAIWKKFLFFTENCLSWQQ
jgi:hypothetical protein